MKRKRTPPGKLTTSELEAAGHHDLAEHLRSRLRESIRLRRRPKFNPPKGRSFYPVPTTTSNNTSKP